MKSLQFFKSSARLASKFAVGGIQRDVVTAKQAHQQSFRFGIAATVATTMLASAVLLQNNDTILNETKKKSKKSRRVIILDDDDEEEDDDEEGDEEEDAFADSEKQRQLNIKNKPPLSMVFNITDFESIARATMNPGTWGYYSTGSSDEFTLRENHYAFGRIFFRPRTGIDVSNVSTKGEMLGQPVDAPFYITAFAGSSIAHPDAELNLIRGAGKNGIVHLIPKQLTFPLDEFCKEAKKDQVNFYQVHFYSQEQVDELPAVFAKIEKELPNIKGYFINVDLATVGNREKDYKIRASIDPDSVEELNHFTSDSVQYFNPTWETLKGIRTKTKLPIVLKGIQRKEDALIAAQIGYNGALLSNHGGRQLDFSMPPIEVLAQSKKHLRENGIKDEDFQFFIDGGVRRGSDIIKALCLGATGVGLGRPFLYAMNTYGEEGVDRAIKILKAEMIRDMKLLGVNSLKDLNEDMVDIESLKFKGLTANDSAYDRNYQEMPTPSFRR